MFEEFMTNKVPKPDKSVSIDFSGSIFVSPENIKDKFSDIDNMDDVNIYNLFVQYFDTLLDSIFIVKDTYMINLFTNKKFITMATQAAYSIKITDSQRKRCNKLVYDYLIKKDRDESSCNLLIAFSNVINRDITPRLCGLGLSKNTACMVAMSRYSSEKELINVRRLNKILMKEPETEMTEQMIVNIYCILFNSALDMFEGVMYDIASYQSMNHNEIEIYGTITLAVLDIVDQLPMTTIKELLRRFTENNRIMYPDNRLRFNIESFSPDDYPRIMTVITQLKDEGLDFPRS